MVLNHEAAKSQRQEYSTHLQCPRFTPWSSQDGSAAYPKHRDSPGFLLLVLLTSR